MSDGKPIEDLVERMNKFSATVESMQERALAGEDVNDDVGLRELVNEVLQSQALTGKRLVDLSKALQLLELAKASLSMAALCAAIETEASTEEDHKVLGRLVFETQANLGHVFNYTKNIRDSLPR